MKFKKQMEINVHQLFDAIYYSLANVLIIPVGNIFQLLVISRNGIDYEKMYATLDRAKTAFHFKYGGRLLECAAEKGHGHLWLKVSVEVKWLFNRLGRKSGGMLMDQLKAS